MLATIYPVGYVVLDTVLVLSIRYSTLDGKLPYRTASINALAEFLKLCTAMCVTFWEGGISELFRASTKARTVLLFLLPNLAYAINNNLFHVGVGAGNPAMFVLTINCFRTIGTSLLQPFVSGIPVTPRQHLACWFLVLSFLSRFAIVTAYLTFFFYWPQSVS